MRNADRLMIPAYALAGVLVLFPVLDLGLQIWPMLPAQAQWRFGSIGIASRTMITPLLGLLLFYAIALEMGHRWVLWIFTLVSGLLVVLILGLLGLFVVDAIEIRARVNADASRRFDLTTGVAAVKLGCGLVVAFAFAIVGRRAAQSAPRRPAVAGPGIVATTPGLRDDPDA